MSVSSFGLLSSTLFTFYWLSMIWSRRTTAPSSTSQRPANLANSSSLNSCNYEPVEENPFRLDVTTAYVFVLPYRPLSADRTLDDIVPIIV